LDIQQPCGECTNSNTFQTRPAGRGTHADFRAKNEDTVGQGETSMTSTETGEGRAQVLRWVEEGRTVLEAVLRLLTDLDQVKQGLEAAQNECARLKQEGEQLRAEVSRLQADAERSQRERKELATWFTTVMNETVSRLRSPQPAA
jgi:chromosome segregation ATPase